MTEATSLRGLYTGLIVDADELQMLKTLGHGATGTTQLSW